MGWFDDILDDWFGFNPPPAPPPFVPPVAAQPTAPPIGETPEQIAAQAAADQALVTQQDQLRQQEEARQAAAAEAERARLSGLRTSAGEGARSSAQQYFQSRGLDPGQFSPGIEAEIGRIMSTIGEGDPNPAGYFSNIGADVYGAEQEALRGRAGTQLGQVFTPGFERQRIASTVDDPYLANIQTGQRELAQQMIDRLSNRGVINPSGRTAALGELSRQDPFVRSQLSDVGGGIVESGRENLRGIADRARTEASSLTPGQAFDIGTYRGEADTALNEWLSGLGDALTASAPTNLYDVSNLSNIAGAAQGPGNLAFVPGAAFADEEQKKKQDEEVQAPQRASFF